MIWKFHGITGREEFSPMWWKVEDGGVWESYDQGKSWILNCQFEVDQAGWDFVADWFSQFYGH